MILLALLLFMVAEVVAFVEVAAHIGVLDAIVLLIVISACGPALVRRVGLGVMAHTRERLGRGEAPTQEVLDGIVLLIGGVFVCVPGFIGDVIGLLLLFGPVRHLVIRVAGRRLARSVGLSGGRVWVWDRSGRGGGRVVDASTHDPGGHRGESPHLLGGVTGPPPDPTPDGDASPLGPGDRW